MLSAHSNQNLDNPQQNNKNPKSQKDSNAAELTQRNEEYSVKVNRGQNERRNHLVGIVIIVFEIGCIITHFSGSYFVSKETTYTEFFSLLLLAFFVIMGFGMMLSIFRFGSWLGIVTAIITVAVSLQFTPIIQKIFFGAFNTSYGNDNLTDKVGLNISNFWIRYVSTKVQIGEYTYRIGFISCISFLTLMTALIGRITITQIINSVVIFMLVWNINFFLLVYFCVVRQDHHWSNVYTPYIFDTFGSSYTYLFAAFYGIIFNFMIKKQTFHTSHYRNISNTYTLLISLIGTVCILSTFIFSSNNLIQFSRTGENIKRFSMLFAILGSVAGTFIGSALSRRGWVGYKQVIVGTITGGIMMGAAAPTLVNIGISIAVGLVGGIISGFSMKLIQSKINKTKLYDVLGLFGPFFISAVLGSVIVPIMTLLIIYNGQKSSNLNNLQKKLFDSAFPSTLITYQLIYPGISAGMGLVGGLLSGLVCRMEKDTFGFMTSARYFINDFGLKAKKKQNYLQNKPLVQPKKPENVDNSNSAAIIVQQWKKQL